MLLLLIPPFLLPTDFRALSLSLSLSLSLLHSTYTRMHSDALSLSLSISHPPGSLSLTCATHSQHRLLANIHMLTCVDGRVGVRTVNVCDPRCWSCLSVCLSLSFSLFSRCAHVRAYLRACPLSSSCCVSFESVCMCVCACVRGARARVRVIGQGVEEEG
jgi:hypothetical protein